MKAILTKIKELKSKELSKRIEEITSESIENFALAIGHENSIKKLIKTLSKYDEESFETIGQKTLTAISISQPSTSTATIDESYKVPFGKILTLDKNIDYGEIIEKRLSKIVKAVAPLMTPQFEMKKVLQTDQKVVYECPCIFCPPDLGRTIPVSAYISKNYLRLGVSNFTTHLKLHKELAPIFEEIEVKKI